MARRTKEEIHIDELKTMAVQVGIDDNPLFCTALDQYVVQLKVINLIRAELDKTDLSVSKQYVKGRENLYAHPLVKELPKHSDSATKTATFLWSMIRDASKIEPKSNGSDDFEELLKRRSQL